MLWNNNSFCTKWLSSTDGGGVIFKLSVWNITKVGLIHVNINNI